MMHINDAVWQPHAATLLLIDQQTPRLHVRLVWPTHEMATHELRKWH